MACHILEFYGCSSLLSYRIAMVKYCFKYNLPQSELFQELKAHWYSGGFNQDHETSRELHRSLVLGRPNVTFEVRGISSITIDILRGIFSAYGRVVKLEKVEDVTYVSFERETEGLYEALRNINSLQIGDSELRVRLVTPGGYEKIHESTNAAAAYCTTEKQDEMESKDGLDEEPLCKGVQHTRQIDDSRNTDSLVEKVCDSDIQKDASPEPERETENLGDTENGTRGNGAKATVTLASRCNQLKEYVVAESGKAVGKVKSNLISKLQSNEVSSVQLEGTAVVIGNTSKQVRKLEVNEEMKADDSHANDSLDGERLFETKRQQKPEDGKVEPKEEFGKESQLRAPTLLLFPTFC